MTSKEIHSKIRCDNNTFQIGDTIRINNEFFICINIDKSYKHFEEYLFRYDETNS